MKKLTAILLAAAMMASLAACSSQQESKSETTEKATEKTAEQTADKNTETVYQVALLQSLTQGYYDGIIKVSELKQHGDIGIGTFEGVTRRRQRKGSR